MTARQKRNEDPLEEVILPDDDLLDLEQEAAGVRRYGDLFVHDAPQSFT